MPAKVLVFGVDAMEPKLICEWIESGQLPNLARLRARSAWGHVLNPPRFFSGASWPNFYTGATPARHGQYLRTRYEPNTRVHRPLRPDFDQVAPFWSAPEWRDKRTAIINVPYCPLNETINGLQVVGWDAHDRHHEGVRTAPVDLAKDILHRFGRDPVGNCETLDFATSALTDLRDSLMRHLHQKRDMACEWLASSDWDLFVSVLDECHCAGHRFWHLHDAQHPRHDPHLAATLGGALKDVYIEIDRALGSVVDLLGSGATIVFLSSHGMGPAFDGTPLLDEVLRRLDGFGRRHANYEKERTRRLAHLGAISDRMPRPIQRTLAPLRRRFGRGQLGKRLDAERTTRTYFWFPTHDLTGAIRINLAGREASGTVQPGREYAVLISRLERDLHELRDGRSGEPIVAELVRTADMDLAGYAGDFPDLIVRWSKASLGWIESPKIGRIDPVLVRGRTGDHDPAMQGIFFAAGPDTTPGPIPEPVRLEDFAPTISSLLGIHLEDTQGRIIPAVCARPRRSAPAVAVDRTTL